MNLLLTHHAMLSTVDLIRSFTILEIHQSFDAARANHAPPLTRIAVAGGTAEVTLEGADGHALGAGGNRELVAQRGPLDSGRS